MPTFDQVTVKPSSSGDAVGFQVDPSTANLVGRGGEMSGTEFGVHGIALPSGGAAGVVGDGPINGVVGNGGVRGVTGNGPIGVGGFGTGSSGIGVAGVGAQGPEPTAAQGTVGVVGWGGTGDAAGVEGHGSGTGPGVAAYGDPTEGFGVVASGLIGLQASGLTAISAAGSAVSGSFGVYSEGSTGVVGHANGAGGSDGAGVVGTGGGRAGTGVVGFGAGQQGEAPTSESTGVYGQGAVGVVGTGIDAGVRASGSTGLQASSTGGQNIAIFAVGGPSKSSPSYAAYLVGELYVHGSLSVLGKKSAVVPLPDGTLRRLYALESPESWFEDFGFGILTAGRARIDLDADFAATVDTDAYHVFLSEYEGDHGLFVAGRSSTGFEVHSRAEDADGARFSYRVVARRALDAPRLEVVTPPPRPSLGSEEG